MTSARRPSRRNRRLALAPLSFALVAGQTALAIAQVQPLQRPPVPIPGPPPAVATPPTPATGTPPIGPTPTLGDLIRLHGFQIVAVTQPTDVAPLVFVQKANAAYFCRFVKDGPFAPRPVAEFGGYRCAEIR